MPIFSIFGVCMMAISFIAQVIIDAKQKSINPKPLTDEEYKSLIAQWVFCFGLGVLVFVIGLL